MKLATHPFWVTSATEPGLHLRVHGFPAPLVGGPFPNRLQPDWLVLKKAGVRQIVCLAGAAPELRYDPYPAGLDWLAKEDMPELGEFMEPGGAAALLSRAFGHAPEDEAFNARRAARGEMRQIAQAVLAALWRGEGVFVHCEYGVERTGLLIALVLTLAGGEAPAVTHSVARALSLHMGGSDDLRERLLNVVSAVSLDATN